MVKNTSERTLFQGIPLQTEHRAAIFPEHMHSLYFVSARNAIFPEHVHSLSKFQVFVPQKLRRIFRSICIHFYLCKNTCVHWGGTFGVEMRVLVFSKEYNHSHLPKLYYLHVEKVQLKREEIIMAGKVKRMSTIKQILLLKKQGYSNRRIARELGNVDKGTVNRYVRTIREEGLDIDELLNLEDHVLATRFHAGDPAYTDERMEDFLRELPMYVEKLKRPHMTRFLVWQEYKKAHPDGYGKSQFFYHLKQNLVAQPKVTAVLSDTYEPGNMLYIDFAGDKLSYVDEDTGEVIKVETFVATMPYSDYCFAICVPSQRTGDLIYALRLCMEYLGGVPKIVVTDNMKSAVKSAHKYEPEISRAMEDMGNFYHFVTIACQPRKPTHKALVENQVRLIYRRVYTKLGHRTFFSIRELNDAVFQLVTEHNQTRMQKRPYSREERFHATEKPLLQPLPKGEYEMRYYAHLTVQQNGFVELRRDGVTQFYSVPYTLIGKKAEVIYTERIVNIYVDNTCVATHPRRHTYGYTQKDEHLASYNLAQTSKSPAYYKERAERISSSFKTYVEAIFNPSRSSNPPEIYYKTCDMLFGLQRRHPQERFNATCELCLQAGIFKGKQFEAVLKNATLFAEDETVTRTTPVPTNHVNMRGQEYYK